MSASTLPHFDMQPAAAHYAEVQGLCTGVSNEEAALLLNGATVSVADDGAQQEPVSFRAYPENVMAALGRAIDSRFKAPEPKEVTDAEIDSSKARYRMSMTSLDVSDLFCCDAMVAAVVAGDRDLIGNVAFTLVDKWTESLAMRELCGADIDQEAEAMKVVNNWVAAKAAALPAHKAVAMGVVLLIPTRKKTGRQRPVSIHLKTSWCPAWTQAGMFKTSSVSKTSTGSPMARCTATSSPRSGR